MLLLLRLLWHLTYWLRQLREQHSDLALLKVPLPDQGIALRDFHGLALGYGGHHVLGLFHQLWRRFSRLPRILLLKNRLHFVKSEYGGDRDPVPGRIGLASRLQQELVGIIVFIAKVVVNLAGEA